MTQQGGMGARWGRTDDLEMLLSVHLAQGHRHLPGVSRSLLSQADRNARVCREQMFGGAPNLDKDKTSCHVT